jgi:hypothetical protein
MQTIYLFLAQINHQEYRLVIGSVHLFTDHFKTSYPNYIDQ